ncbi:DUF72 domain-containing protein [Desertivirga xinjiangensis]|uniref:DUF72 domain-containing protein n=1 Tax=Desertivirga xinjiangensis TaxID=539206 RepID=UPI00210D690E|nr:DUF72 domain-containing protein [Pedobacter xinjiangensis]
MIKWHIGCSGFYYKHWKGSFYPEGLAQSKWFDYYCKHFNTLELNVTFYRFPRISLLQSWYGKSPADFRFAVKAPRAITHFKQFIGVTDMLADFYSTAAEGLQEKLGCVLFQMGPRFVYKPERLERILTNLDSSFLNVVEFRDPSWWQEDVFKQLRSKNISFCGMSHPTLPKDIVINAPLLYYRLHGEGELYASDYKEEQLQALVDVVKNENRTEDAYIFFNNDIHTYAVYNALSLQKLTSGLNT